MGERVADIDRARDAVNRESWREAYDELSSFDPTDLDARDLEALADAAWWLSKTDESLSIRQRAYGEYAAAGDQPRAAYNAGRLAVEHFLRGAPSVGAGWLMRADRHLAEQPECAEHGFLAVIEATVARFGGDLEGAMTLADRAADIGRGFGDRDVWALAIHTQGLIHITAGRVTKGLPLLDEAMTSVVAGELSSYFTGVVYCNVIQACLDLADVARAGEWSEAARAWCESVPPESPYPGLCRINRAEVASLRGAWAEAEVEARRASDELMRFDPMAAAQAFYETGEIRRRMGNVVGAEECFARARELGFEPQPGLALLRLAQGKAETALATLRVAASESTGSRLRRARLLAAEVDVALAVGDMETAGSAADDLEALADDSPIAALDAAAATARGSLSLAEGEIAGALERFRHASSLWQRLRLPYETAQGRALYGRALRAAGDEEAGTLELRAALSAFERLGATSDAHRVTMLMGRAELPRGLTAREAEVLRLVAAGKTNREIATDLVISEHTVARHLQNTFAKIDVSSRSGATAFAFEHGLA